MNYERHKLNGLDIVLVDMPDSHATTIEIFAKAGSIYEDKKTNGLSHFLEHMFFKGGKKYQTPQAVASAIDAFGANFNAYTGDEYSGYYITCAPRYSLKSIEILADMLVSSQFPKEEMEREKGVVLQEIKMYEDNPQRLVRKKATQWYYGNTPFGHTILGPEKNVLGFSQDDLFLHKKNLYTKDNIVIVVAGKLSSKTHKKDDVLSSLAELFDGLDEKKSIDRPSFVASYPQKQESSFSKETQQNHLVMMARGFALENKDRYVAEVICNLLGGTMSSRLFQNVREKRGLCYYIGSYHYENNDYGTFKINAGMDKEKRDEGLAAIYAEVADVAEGNITQKELNHVKGNIIGSTEMGIETTGQMAGFIGFQALFQKEIRSLEDMLSDYEAVSLEDMKRVGQRLEKKNLYSYWVE